MRGDLYTLEIWVLEEHFDISWDYCRQRTLSMVERAFVLVQTMEQCRCYYIVRTNLLLGGLCWSLFCMQRIENLKIQIREIIWARSNCTSGPFG